MSPVIGIVEAMLARIVRLEDDLSRRASLTQPDVHLVAGGTWMPTLAVPPESYGGGTVATTNAPNMFGPTQSFAGNVEVSGTILAEPWNTATLSNGWQDFGAGYTTVQYRKDAANLVFLKGMARNGAVGSAIVTLPAGYRPGQRHLFVATSNAGLGRVDILTTGGVVPITGGTGWLSLDGIAFWAEA